MTPELDAYYMARFSMCSEKGWKDLIEDVQKMMESTNRLADVPDEKTLYKRQGELAIMRWLLTLEITSRDIYDDLKANDETSV